MSQLQICDNCGEEYEPDDEFCPHCDWCEDDVCENCHQYIADCTCDEDEATEEDEDEDVICPDCEEYTPECVCGHI